MTSDPRSGACWKCHRIHTSADPCPHVNTRLGEHSEADAVALTPQEAEAALSDVGNGVDPVTVDQLAAAGFVLARKAGA